LTSAKPRETRLPNNQAERMEALIEPLSEREIEVLQRIRKG
jgi:DNA-binding CsgD family transcriptional regulator